MKFLGLLFFSTFAFAGSVNFEFRFESDSSSFNNAAKTAGSSPSTAYLMRTGRVDFRGKLNEDVSYRLRTRFDKDASIVQNKTDGFSSQIDFACIQHQMNDYLKLTLGKFASEIGSIEGSQSSSDIYLQSQVYKKISSNGFLYVSGAKLTGNYLDQEVSTYVVNQSETATTEQSKATYGVTYKGSFVEKKLLPLLGFLKDEKQTLLAGDSKASTTITTAGIKWDPKTYFVNLDYLIYTQKNVSAVATNDTWSTILLEAGYDFEGLIPKIKYEITDRKSEAATTTKEKIDGIALGIEYRPFQQDTYRYHLMVTQLNSKTDGSDSLYEQHVLLGTKIYGDFLK